MAVPSTGAPPRVWGRRGQGRLGRAGQQGQPHAGGDNASSAFTPSFSHGAPPRVWRRRAGRRGNRPRRRATPTRVGTTNLGIVVSATEAGHPHACGDDGVSGQPGAIRLGPPPRVWGRLVVPADAERHPRATPTRVGTTTGPDRARAPRTGHPHACGDDGRLGDLGRLGNGPPPRVWGRPFGPCFLNPVNPVNPVFFSSIVFCPLLFSPMTCRPPRGRGRRRSGRAR